MSPSMIERPPQLSVAPMMDRTDRHFRISCGAHSKDAPLHGDGDHRSNPEGRASGTFNLMHKSTPFSPIGRMTRLRSQNARRLLRSGGMMKSI